MNNSTLYSDQFTGIDGDPHARLPEETMDLMNSHIRQCFGNMDGLVDLVNGQLAGVSDIISIPAVDTNDLAEAYQEVIDYVQGKEEDIAEADEEMLPQTAFILSGMEYLEGARSVMSSGYKVSYSYKNEIRTGYVQFMGTSKKGNAKFAFVGTDNNGYITTFHTENGKTFWKMLNGINIPVINQQ